MPLLLFYWRKPAPDQRQGPMRVVLGGRPGTRTLNPLIKSPQGQILLVGSCKVAYLQPLLCDETNIVRMSNNNSGQMVVK